MKIKSANSMSDMACPKCRFDGAIDWTKVVQVCAVCKAEYKVVNTARRRWVSFLLQPVAA